MGATPTRMLAALAALAAALSLSACGGDAVSLDPVAEAATKTGAVESMRVAMTMTMTLPGAVEPTTLEMNGVAEGGNAAITTTMPEIDGVEVGEMEVRLLGTVMYMRMPFLQQAGSGLKPWIELDMQKLGKDMGVDFQALLDAGQQSDPTQSLQMLRAAGGDIEELGEAEVRGVRTTHYRATVDFEGYADQLEQDGKQAAARSVREVVRLTGQTTVPMEIWVDEGSLVRRMKWEQAMPGAEGASPTTAETTMELYDFGADVEVTRPPADETMSFEELQELGAD